MPVKGYEVNHKASERWALAVGKFALNVGAIETLTHVWIRKLTPDIAVYDEAGKSMFKARVRIVGRLLKTAPISNAYRTECEKVWEEAVDLAEVRNMIVHNGVTLVWKDREDVGEPDMISLPEFKSASGEGRAMLQYLSYDEVIRMGNEACLLAQRLHSAYEKLHSDPG